MDEPEAARGRPLDPELAPAIIRAVLALLAERGYSGLSTAAVAKRAGVSTATLYRRWPSKRNLLLAAARQIADAEAADVDTGTLAGDLRALFAHKRRVLAGTVGPTLLVLLGESAHDAELAAILARGVFTPVEEHFAAIQLRAETRGESLTVTPALAARIVLGSALAGVALPAVGRRPAHALSGDGLLPDAEADALVRLLGGTSDNHPLPGESHRA
ncbi:TetR/AcrR family transcriptional regulator [Leucobacter sp. CSA2]|uniref:TetR/AcrR family transcriptional regulator n=1 Tax=Leucobacter edaphi TaxID=2796472 RepID=A0A934QE55_9MICO|nr:TetR/AcrR family transcriptional regulator [Leucobacter edaphi]MBK0422140.1 TetR/AcrR family transcriptional regulator [Leucobacter edaphi]